MKKIILFFLCFQFQNVIFSQSLQDLKINAFLRTTFWETTDDSSKNKNKESTTISHLYKPKLFNPSTDFQIIDPNYFQVGIGSEIEFPFLISNLKFGVGVSFFYSFLKLHPNYYLEEFQELNPDFQINSGENNLFFQRVDFGKIGLAIPLRLIYHIPFFNERSGVNIGFSIYPGSSWTIYSDLAIYKNYDDTKASGDEVNHAFLNEQLLPRYKNLIKKDEVVYSFGISLVGDFYSGRICEFGVEYFHFGFSPFDELIQKPKGLEVFLNCGLFIKKEKEEREYDNLVYR